MHILSSDLPKKIVSYAEQSQELDFCSHRQGTTSSLILPSLPPHQVGSETQTFVYILSSVEAQGQIFANKIIMSECLCAHKLHTHNLHIIVLANMYMDVMLGVPLLNRPEIERDREITCFEHVISDIYRVFIKYCVFP